MTGEDLYVLGDKDKYPDNEVLYSFLGDKKELWLAVMGFLKENYKDSSGEWRYYNDGRQWLFKMVLKKKTIFWTALMNGTFRITFYFTDKALERITSSTLSENIKTEFLTTGKIGLLRPVSIIVSGHDDLKNIFELIRIKVSLK